MKLQTEFLAKIWAQSARWRERGEYVLGKCQNVAPISHNPIPYAHQRFGAISKICVGFDDLQTGAGTGTEH